MIKGSNTNSSCNGFLVPAGAREVPAQWADGGTAATALDGKTLKLVYGK